LANKLEEAKPPTGATFLLSRTKEQHEERQRARMMRHRATEGTTASKRGKQLPKHHGLSEDSDIGNSQATYWTPAHHDNQQSLADDEEEHGLGCDCPRHRARRARQKNKVQMGKQDPLIRSARHNNFSMLKRLLRAHRNRESCVKYINRVDVSGSTALVHAVWPGNYQIIAMLLATGADPNIQNLRGNTALHFACERNFRTLIKLLIRHGADPFVVNHSEHYCWELQPERITVHTLGSSSLSVL
jgi:ankyrin repeat protein